MFPAARFWLIYFNLAMLKQVQHDGAFFSSLWQLNHLKTVPLPPALTNSGREQSLQYASIAYECGWGAIPNRFELPKILIFAQFCGGNRFTFPTLQFFVTLNLIQGRKNEKILLPAAGFDMPQGIKPDYSFPALF